MARKATAQHPEWALKYKKKGTELRCIRGKYYLYECSSVYDPEKKRARKVTGKYLGSITEEGGLVPRQEKRDKPRHVGQSLEYGITAYYEKHMGDLADKLKKHFPEDWQAIIAMAMCRLVGQDPLKAMQERFENSMMQDVLPKASMSPDYLTGLIRRVGANRKAIVGFCKEFACGGGDIIFDGTDVWSSSKKMWLPKTQKAKSGGFEDLLNMMLVFSVDSQSPVYYRLLPGNIKDVKSFTLCLKEIGIKSGTIIADKGFMKAANVEAVRQAGLSMIIPLKRNDAEIDYAPYSVSYVNSFDGQFSFEDRPIWHKTFDKGDDTYIHEYLDPKLKIQESADFLARMEAKRGKKGFDEGEMMKRHAELFPRMGSIAELAIGVKDPKDAYMRYKSRDMIEQCIDSFKTDIEGDKTYMRDEDALEGFIFANFIALHWHFSIYRNLVRSGNISKYSVKDMIRFLQNVRKVEIDGEWHLCERTKAETKTLQMMELDIT